MSSRKFIDAGQSELNIWKEVFFKELVDHLTVNHIRIINKKNTYKKCFT